MHFVSHSAIEQPPVGALRIGKRQLTAHRITAAAQRLALEHGLDGFTMEQLAELTGVSRRTLFNYFPGKDDAVLGGPPVLDEAVLAEFGGGGPTGRLLEDLAAVVQGILRESPDTREDVARGRRVMLANPRLIALAHQRLQESVASCMGYIEAREGPNFDRRRVDVAIALVLACFHLAMDRYLEEGAEDSDLGELFAATLGTAHDLLDRRRS
jgi:AcrR family transcriptional regulator